MISFFAVSFITADVLLLLLRPHFYLVVVVNRNLSKPRNSAQPRGFTFYHTQELTGAHARV
jgi:hypothetical protein